MVVLFSSIRIIQWRLFRDKNPNPYILQKFYICNVSSSQRETVEILMYAAADTEDRTYVFVGFPELCLFLCFQQSSGYSQWWGAAGCICSVQTDGESHHNDLWLVFETDGFFFYFIHIWIMCLRCMVTVLCNCFHLVICIFIQGSSHAEKNHHSVPRCSWPQLLCSWGFGLSF